MTLCQNPSQETPTGLDTAKSTTSILIPPKHPKTESRSFLSTSMGMGQSTLKNDFMTVEMTSSMPRSIMPCRPHHHDSCISSPYTISLGLPKTLSDGSSPMANNTPLTMGTVLSQAT